MTDYTVGDTIYQIFTTRAFATGIPTTLAGTPVVSAYENDSAVQITAGVTLGVDHDTVTGLNLLTIVATGANGFETGKDYNLVITAGTVDSVSVVGEVVGTFSLGRSAAAADLANATDGLGAIKQDTAATLLDTAEIGVAGAGLTNIDLPNQTMDIVGSITGNLSGSVGSVTGAVGSVTGHTPQTGDSYARLGAPAGASVSADILAVKNETSLIVADTNELQTDDVPGLIAALNDPTAAAIATAVLTTAMTESYAADGAAPTLAQSLFLVQQAITEKTVSGTSLTIKKLDGTTTAAVLTLDDANNPTSATRTS